jgi:hypothetical protein
VGYLASIRGTSVPFLALLGYRGRLAPFRAVLRYRALLGYILRLLAAYVCLLTNNRTC